MSTVMASRGSSSSRFTGDDMQSRSSVVIDKADREPNSWSSLPVLIVEEEKRGDVAVTFDGNVLNSAFTWKL